MKARIITEDDARALDFCPGCKKDKDNSLVVCWGCFKGGANPFKYFNGSLAEWLKLQRS